MLGDFVFQRVLGRYSELQTDMHMKEVDIPHDAMQGARAVRALGVPQMKYHSRCYGSAAATPLIFLPCMFLKPRERLKGGYLYRPVDGE